MPKDRVRRNAIGILALIFLFLLGYAQASTFIVAPDYDNKNIQSTINKADPGDRIIVKSGTYKENIDISKKLSLIGLNSGKGRPVVDAGGRSSAITISIEGVQVVGFEVKNSGRLWKDAGIKILSNKSSVRDNYVSNNEYGIVLDGVSNCLVLNNTLCSNDVGIALYNSESYTISDNSACNNTFGGVLLSKCKNGTIKGNNASSNKWAGIILGESTDNTVTNNIARFNENEGIWLLRSSNNVVRNNRARDNYIFGIQLYYSGRNIVTGNRARYNLDGISLENSNNNFLIGNDMSNNYYGIYTDNSLDNRIYLNNFIDNANNVYTWKSTNFWNSTDRINYQYNNVPYIRYMGNFWSGYSGLDPFGDGLGDDPYLVFESEWDYNPLRFSSENYVMNT